MHRTHSRFNHIVSAWAILCWSTAAIAGGALPFDADAFKEATKAGKPVLVEIHADWCAECKAQNIVLTKLTQEPAFRNVVRFRVDYDRQKELVNFFKARKQSTLVLYKGDAEITRLVGETNERKIRQMVDKAM